MVWVDTKKYQDKLKNSKKEYDIEKLERWKKEGWEPRFVNSPKFLTRLKYARPVKLVARVDPKQIVFTSSSGYNCQNCGLYNRHSFCSPDKPKFDVAQEIIKSYENAIVFVSQNNGMLPWNDDPTKLKHINFSKPKQSFGLRGAEAGTSRYLQGLMKHVEHKARHMGYRAQAFISGHCELCGKCPVKDLRDKNNKQVSCPLGGMPSMETWWIDVYRYYTHGELGNVFGYNKDVIEPLTFVCKDYFTLITLLLYDKKDEKYWYAENLKHRMKTDGSREAYKTVREKIAKSVNNRKKKGIPL